MPDLKGISMATSDAQPIEIEYPAADHLQFRLSVGACRLHVTPGSDSAWASGLYQDPFNALPLKIDQQGGSVRLTQERNWPAAWQVFNKEPQLHLALGKTKPYTLAIEVGASESMYDLGGLPLDRLLIKQGAGRAEFDFSTPNPQPMTLLDLDAGAVALEMSNLANANFAEMTVDGGAAGYKFDFGGQLQRAAYVRITTGMAAVEVRVPSSTACKIVSETTLGGLDVGNGFTRRDDAFWTPAGLSGQTPLLAIQANVTLGSLSLRTD
jgi:hypothetical protein